MRDRLVHSICIGLPTRHRHCAQQMAAGVEQCGQPAQEDKGQIRDLLGEGLCDRQAAKWCVAIDPGVDILVADV